MWSSSGTRPRAIAAFANGVSLSPISFPHSPTQVIGSLPTSGLTTVRNATSCTAMSKEGSMSSSSPNAVRLSASSRLEKPVRGSSDFRARLEPDGSIVEILPDGEPGQYRLGRTGRPLTRQAMRKSPTNRVRTQLTRCVTPRRGRVRSVEAWGSRNLSFPGVSACPSPKCGTGRTANKLRRARSARYCG